LRPARTRPVDESRREGRIGMRGPTSPGHRVSSSDWPVLDRMITSVPDDSTTTAGGPRIGKAVEHLVAASCILMSQGRLNVSMPLVDDEGVGLVFNQHDQPATLAVQVKGRSRSAQVVRRGRFLTDVWRKTFTARDDLYMLFVVYDEALGSYDPVWLIPSVDFVERAGNSHQGAALRFQTSLAGEEGRWRDYRFSREDLPGRVLEVIQQLSARRTLVDEKP
jgi:hypothetical protein